MLQLLIISILLQKAICFTRISLQGSSPQYMDCTSISENDNGFLGTSFFYDNLSQSGSLLNLDQITFTMWFWVHQKMVLQGKQILFAFVDGNSKQPFLNLMLYYQLDQNGYSLNLLNEDLVPNIISLRLEQTNDLYKESWNYVLLSIDQSTSFTFINLKFFSSSNYQLQQIQETLVSQRLNYQFGPHSRITNEQLYGVASDYKACVNIANFDYTNGWTTMDSEIYMDYDIEQVFSLKPYASKGLDVTNLYTDVQLKSFTNNLEYTGTIGMNIYKDTQIVYNFLEQMSSFTIMFWFKPSNIQTTFQFLSLTDDSILETSIGFGVDKFYKLLIYQVYSKTQVTNVNQNAWNNVKVGLLEISRDENFLSTSQNKIIRIYIASNQVYLSKIQNIKAYKRLVIGPVFVDDRGQEVIDIQDIRIFNGYSLLEQNGDCLLFIGLYCGSCKSGTDYCYERNPYDDVRVYNCPGGYREDGDYCVAISVPNCRRFSNGACQQCNTGYYFSAGQCLKTNSPQMSPFNCQDNSAQFCQNTIKQYYNQNPSISSKSKLCKNNLYNSQWYYCGSNSVYACSISQYNQQCYSCWNNYALTEDKVCRSNCNRNRNDRFLNGQYCVRKCPYKYLFKYVCDGTYIDYQCNPNVNCQNGELNIGYYCLTDQQQTVGRTVGCKNRYGQIYYNQQIVCHNSCKYCFGGSDKNCLGCYNGFYYSPYTTSCTTNCNNNSNQFKFTNKIKMTCEYECPSYLYTQVYDCVDVCSSGYVLYKNNCLLANSVPELYSTSSTMSNYNGVNVPVNKYNLCPYLCSGCTSPTYCTSCLNSYPIYQNQCLLSCQPMYLYVSDDNIYSCLDNCDTNDLIYENDNFQGLQLKQCFKNICGTIKANKNYQTFQHQTNNKICSYPCEDGYYGHPVTLLCTPCNSSCATCLNFANYCTSCSNMKFLQDSDCFDSCKSKFSNYVTWTCEGSCSLGYAIIDKNAGIKACVETCGQIFATYVYSLNGYCLQTKPTEKAYCIGFNCYNCHQSCKQCSGSLNNQCLACYPKTYLLNNVCVTDCGAKKYDTVNWQCVDTCPQSSYESSGWAVINSINTIITMCAATCQFNKFQLKDLCYDSFPTGANCEFRSNYYYCEKCSSVCLQCVQNYPTKCTSCPTNYYLLVNTCYTDCPDSAPYKNTQNQTCVNSCQNYQEDGICVTTCKSTSYVYASQKQCYSAGCPYGTYTKSNTQQCYDCYLGCTSCIGGTANDCLSCATNYYSNLGTSCTLTCNTDPNFVYDQVNWKCVSTCPDGTFLQSSADGKLVCKTDCPQYYYSNICVTSCPNQTFLEGVSCLSCAGPCSVCNGLNVNQCSQCDQGFYRDDTTCYEVCPPLKPLINLVDQTCVATCPVYLYLEKTICFETCPSTLYYYELNGKQECVDNCYSKSYLTLGHCLSCNSICKECYGPDNGNCTQCELPYYLNEQSCTLLCPQFYDSTDHVCKDACPVNLVVQGSYCQEQCDTGFVLYNQICQLTCPTFSYMVNNLCLDCHLFCDSCFGSTSTECNSCIQDYYLSNTTCQNNCDKLYDDEDRLCLDDCGTKLEVVDLQKCVSLCPNGYLICESKCLTTLSDGYYSDGIQCQKCDSKCTICTSLTECQACSTNFYLEVQSCVNQCSNKYLYMDPISKTCVTKCPAQLYHLESFGKRFCVYDCQFKLQDQCVTECPIGMYSDNKICKKCSSTCLQCTEATQCQACVNGYYLENGSCLLTCLTNKTDRKNIQCVTSCDPTLYEYQNECLESCPTSPLVYENKMLCSQNCPNSTYLQQQECLDCDISCSSCIGPTHNDCISCNQGYYLDNQICTNSCTDLYDMVNLKCVLTCPESLFQNQNQCVSVCPLFTFNKECLSSCPAQTYDYNLICYDCSDNCLSCNYNGCLECGNTTYLNDGLCSSVCSVLYDDVKFECVEACPNQTYLYIDHCYSQCPINTYQYKTNCLLICPSLTVFNDGICEECPERCSNCQNIITCLECFSPYYLFNGQCVVNCPLIMPYADEANGVCLEQCTPDVYVKQFKCVKNCDLVIYQTYCLEKCPDGYYGEDICKPCRLECKACDNWDICTKCSDNYYLEFSQCDTQCTLIKDLQKQSCVDTCDNLLYQNVCYQACPINTYEFGSICVVNCNDGYYGSDQWKCEKCSNKCLLCTSYISCQKCKTGYFLYNTDCLSSCPDPLYSNSILNQCSSSCPVKTFVYQNQCLFDCPDSYYNDIENYKCVQNCSNNQYLVKRVCYSCSIECDGCYGDGNENCINCATNYTKDDKGFCQGTFCKAGYYKADLSCQKCLHKCSTCNNGTDCTKCRGTNRKAQDCSCPIGYYDDEFYEECQKCPCDECTQSDNCLVCNNNLQLPKCSCDRQLNADWCITCQVGKVKIQFSGDLDQINVYFGYLVTVNLINPFQPSDCSQWFDNSEVFGTNATCYLAWDRYSVIINLQPYSTINIGDKIDFKQDFYKDIDQGLCDEEYISTFIENTVYAPASLVKPYVEFTIPSFVSACKEIEVKQILKSGTAKRIQKILNWQLLSMDNEEYYLQMDTFLALQQNEMVIPSKTLQPNTTYKITAKYINMLDRVNYTTFTFTTLPIQSPYVYFTLDPLIVHIYVFDCHVSFQDMTTTFFIQIDVVDKNNASINYISLSEQINPIYKVELNETLLPKETLLLFKVSTGSSTITETIVLTSKSIEIQFLQTDRFIGLDNQINARGYDRNIQDEILSTMNITYEWLCTNLYNLQPCKTDENQIMQFPSRRIANIYADSQNTTLVFYVKASKQQRWSVKEQLIVVTDFNIEEQFYYNQETPKNYINLNDEITILIKNQQNYAFIIQKHKVIQSQKIVGQTLKFRLADFTNILNPVYIYLIPGKESISFQLNKPPEDIIFSVSPLEGKAMDYFNYSLENIIEGSKISIYYYFDNQTLEGDIGKQQTINGFPLIMDSSQSIGSFQLPNGVSDNAISILCQIEASYGAKSYIAEQVKVTRQNYELSSLINSFSVSSNQTNLNSLHTMVTLISLEQSQVCLKQCSGVGTCKNQKCECPPGYYFDDCSGDQNQYKSFLGLMEDSLKQLIKQSISNSDEFKLYSQSLLYFSQFMDLLDGYSIDDCQKILQQYITNTNSRLEQINQYSINLQYYSTGDFNFSQIDIRSLVNQADFYTALQSTKFMWNKTLFSTEQSVYQLQMYLQQFITNIIDLSLISISFDEELYFQIDVADIKIMKTSNLPLIVNKTQQSSRILLESNSTISYYDVILSIYIRNFYALDGYFPYPTQIYPLYDYQIRNSNKKQNIELQNNISYKFHIYNNTDNLVCLTRNSTTYYWQKDNCYIDQINETYFCNCSILAPTTIVNDLQFLYQGTIPFYLNLPNIFFVVYLIQLIILLIVSQKAKNQKGEIILNQQDQIKYGQVFKLIRSKKILGFNKELKELNYNEKEKINSEGRITINNQSPLSKFHFNQLWKYHVLTSIIFNQKFYLSTTTRIISQIIKLNLLTIIGQILLIYNFSFEIILSSIFGSIIAMRVIEKLTYKNFKFLTYKKLEIVIFLIKFSLILVFIGSFVIIGYLYLKIEDQTYLILCHSISYSVDWLIIDIFVFVANRFLGQEMKKQIRDKLKSYNQQKEFEARKEST